MFLVSKAARAGIVIILLTPGILEPRPTPLASGANLRKEVPAVGHRNDVKKMQQTLRGKGHYRGKVDGVFGLRTRGAFGDFRKLRICQSPSSLIPRRPVNSGSDRGVARRLATRVQKVNLRQAKNGLKVPGNKQDTTEGSQDSCRS